MFEEGSSGDNPSAEIVREFDEHIALTEYAQKLTQWLYFVHF